MERKIEFPTLKSFSDLFSDFSFEKETAPLPHKWRFEDCDFASGKTSTEEIDIGSYCSVRVNGEYRSLYVRATDWLAGEFHSFKYDSCGGKRPH